MVCIDLFGCNRFILLLCGFLFDSLIVGLSDKKSVKPLKIKYS